MKNTIKSRKTYNVFAWLQAMLVATLLASSLGATAAVLPPNSYPSGKSYAKWSAAWWQWLFSLPADGNPGTDSPDFDVTAGQSGRVWFLAGPFGTFERN